MKNAILAVLIYISGSSQAQQTWLAYPEKVDLLAVIAHPDDEGYWGGLLPYYARCEGKSIVLVSLTSGEWGNGMPHPVQKGEEPDCSYDDSYYPCFPAIPRHELTYPNYYRETELANALQIYGIFYPAITPRYKDMNGIGWDDAQKGLDFWGGTEEVTRYIVSQIRRFKPDVVVGLDWNGGNGNPQHAAAARATIYAVNAASDPKAYTEDGLRPWQVKKAYSHLRNEDIETSDGHHMHEWNLECKLAPKANARELGAKGNAAHVSQEMKEECDPFNAFVLQFSIVGKDRNNRNNLFENL